MSLSNIKFKDLPLKDLLSPILALFTIPDVPIPPIPPQLIFGTVNNPGLSARKTASNIIARQSEAGAPFGPLPDGSDNISEKMELIRLEEIIKMLQQDARISVVVPPGILSQGTAISPVGPLPVVTTSISPSHSAQGIMQ